MPSLNPMDFKRAGTPEYVLAQAKLVTAFALEQSGMVDPTSARILAIATLREQGIFEAGLVDLQRTIEKTCQGIKKQRASSPAKPM